MCILWTSQINQNYANYSKLFDYLSKVWANATSEPQTVESVSLCLSYVAGGMSLCSHLTELTGGTSDLYNTSRGWHVSLPLHKITPTAHFHDILLHTKLSNSSCKVIKSEAHSHNKLCATWCWKHFRMRDEFKCERLVLVINESGELSVTKWCLWITQMKELHHNDTRDLRMVFAPCCECKNASGDYRSCQRVLTGLLLHPQCFISHHYFRMKRALARQ